MSVDTVPSSLVDPLCEMLFIVAERFMSSLEAIQYITRFIEECQEEDPLQSIVNEHAWTYLVKAFEEEDEAIQCVVLEQLLGLLNERRKSKAKSQVDAVAPLCSIGIEGRIVGLLSRCDEGHLYRVGVFLLHLCDYRTGVTSP